MQALTHDDVAKYLKERGIRPSIQRIAVMSYMMQNLTHPTADDIYTYLAPTYPSLSRTTVYNTLTLLAASGVIKTLGIDNANTRYDFTETRHGHFRCTCCGKIMDVMLEELPRHILPAGVKTISLADICYTGVCSECAQDSDSYQ